MSKEISKNYLKDIKKMKLIIFLDNLMELIRLLTIMRRWDK